MKGTRNLIVLIAGVVLVVAGFAYLARGSITLAPVLLVLGYCVAIPVGIAIGAPRNGRASASESDERANSSAG